MIEALWSVEFISNLQGAGAGVAVFETGRVLGGDAGFTYIGTYQANGGTLKAEVVVSKYNATGFSVFGDLQKFTLRLEGVPKHDTFDVQGYVVENPNLKIVIRLTRRAELP